MASLNNSSTHNEQEESHIIKCAQNVFKNYLDMPVWQLRHLQVSRYIDSHKIKRVLDIGCAEGTLINRLSRSSSIEFLVGLDCDEKVLEKAELVTNNVEPELMQDSIGYSRKNPLIVQLYNINAFAQLPLQKFKSIQLVTMIQFIQHVQQQSLPELCKQVFERISPNYVIITTPNQEFNVHFNFKIGQMRHPEHLYQWTREQFKQFCQRVSGKYQYKYEMFGIGEHISNDQYGFCSQGAFFTRLKPKQNIQSIGQSSNRNIIEPIKHIRYPFWKDTINNRIEGEIRNILLNYNYSSPQEIAELFKLSKIGKKMHEKQQKIQQEKLETIDEHFIIRWAKTMKYCGYDGQRNQIFYQYEESIEQQQLQYEYQPENNEQWQAS